MAKSPVKQKKRKEVPQAEQTGKKINIGFFRRPAVHILIIIAVGFLIYSNTFHVPFVYDDTSFIVENPAIKDFSYFKNPWEVLTIPTVASNYRTQFITRIFANFTFALNYAWHGLDVGGYHVFNLVVHLTNALLVYLLVLVTFRTPFFSSRFGPAGPDSAHYAGLIALFSALIFVSHPVQTQAVTYITQRFASLVTTFYLLSIILYVKSRLSASSGTRIFLYAAAVVSVICAMLTKENAFTLPFAIVLYEVMFLDGKPGKRILHLLPIIATMIIIPLIVLKAHGMLDQMRAVDDELKIAGVPPRSRWDYLITQFRVLMTYTRLLVFPVNQNLDYDFPIFTSLLTPSVFISFLFLILMFSCSIYCFYLSKRSDMKDRHELRLVSYGMLWFFITLSIESSVIALDNVIYEHRIYLPSAMLIAAFTTFLFWSAERIKKRLPMMGKAVIPVLVLIVLVFSGATYARNRVWQNGISLWEDTVKKSPGKARAYYNLGVFYSKNNRLEDAIGAYQAAIRIYPGFAAAHSDLGAIYGKQGRLEDAGKELKSALKINPDFAEAHINMAVLFEKQGRMQEAAEELKTALDIDPYNAFTHTNLGVIYAKQGRLEEAEGELQTAIKLRPDFEEAKNFLQLVQRERNKRNIPGR